VGGIQEESVLALTPVPLGYTVTAAAVDLLPKESSNVLDLCGGDEEKAQIMGRMVRYLGVDFLTWAADELDAYEQRTGRDPLASLDEPALAMVIGPAVTPPHISESLRRTHAAAIRIYGPYEPGR
jgi:hypothetical protein